VIYGDEPHALFFCADRPERYVELAVKLAVDPSLRRAAGEANRAFVQQFLSDRERMARIVAGHLLELMADARQVA